MNHRSPKDVICFFLVVVVVVVFFFWGGGRAVPKIQGHQATKQKVSDAFKVCHSICFQGMLLLAWFARKTIACPEGPKW